MRMNEKRTPKKKFKKINWKLIRRRIKGMIRKILGDIQEMKPRGRRRIYEERAVQNLIGLPIVTPVKEEEKEENSGGQDTNNYRETNWESQYSNNH